MSHITGFSSLAVATLLLQSVRAADCNLAQPRRSGDPPGADIASDLRGQDNALLQSVCNGGFPPGSDTISTWNTGSQIYNATRTDNSQPLQYCFDALDNIITQCIENDNYWGGDWKLGNEIYAIYDSTWPEHVLQAELESPSSSSAQEAPSSPAPEAPAGATVVTTTIDGSPITQTFVPTTIADASPTTSSTTVDGVVVPLIIGAGGVAWVPFVPAGGAPPAVITPPADLPNGGDGDGDNNPQSSSQDSSSSSSSSTSSRSLRAPDDVFPADAGTATFDSGAAAQIVFFGAAAPTPTSSSSSVAPSEPTTDLFAEAKKLCHERCASHPGLTTPDGQWCLGNCGCFLGAAGC
ncbi:hypothetical protein P171DRAFT_439546 [Karstenula rhodostoma CBS 690.94]|uniref:Uncharacterized protein n=1 Tax=Karstenula rhodostoma CBS 690.94 TaxID=1392251 RepID=A0A9P4PV48_9PLEO|nr:hypothetical protein P171DRAFT_439546 [Karstenula rhodostoma CBS 690.94]